jgi:ArsR family transcriptional regulator
MKRTERTPEQDLEARAELFKTLGHPARLLILSLLKGKPRHVEELAAILQLSPATVSHHLSRLSTAGLVQSEKAQYFQTYSLCGDLMGWRLGELVFLVQPGLAARVEEDAYRQKVLSTFLRQGRLVSIPAQLKKRLIVLEKLVEEFEPGQTYTEREVNQVLVDYHDDVATLRRDMIGYGLMQREGDIYWRVGRSTTVTAESG